MKMLIQEVEGEGMVSLLGKNIEVFCGIYIYAGKLVGVNDKSIKLENPHIVYETGGFLDKKYKDAQHMGRNVHYIAIPFIESFGESHKLG